jgi:two-component system nitrate/nitrite response regulator NarL
MGERVSALVIERRSLVREALVSLMTNHSYHVVGCAASTADLDECLVVADAPELVILGPLPPEEVAITASSVRNVWPDAKIILLFEHLSPADCRELLASEVDGCIPLFASAEMLVGMLQQIFASDLRILVQVAAPSATASREEGGEPHLDRDNLARPADEAASFPTEGGAGSIRKVHGLSQREEQVLRGLVKGHSNKVIARTYQVAEATIKVHMKSILRKIRVANRTQVAIWAIEQGYRAEDDQAGPRPSLTPSHRVGGVLDMASG